MSEIGLQHIFDQISALSATVTARLDGIEARFDRVDERFGVLEARLDRIEDRLDKLEFRLDTVEVRLTAMDERFDKVDARLAGFEQDIAAMKNDLHAFFPALTNTDDMVRELNRAVLEANRASLVTQGKLLDISTEIATLVRMEMANVSNRLSMRLDQIEADRQMRLLDIVDAIFADPSIKTVEELREHARRQIQRFQRP